MSQCWDSFYLESQLHLGTRCYRVLGKEIHIEVTKGVCRCKVDCGARETLRHWHKVPSVRSREQVCSWGYQNLSWGLYAGIHRPGRGSRANSAAVGFLSIWEERGYRNMWVIQLQNPWRQRLWWRAWLLVSGLGSLSLILVLLLLLLSVFGSVILEPHQNLCSAQGECFSLCLHFFFVGWPSHLLIVFL